MSNPDQPRLYAPARADWLGSPAEEVIRPDLPIVDAHHHLWERPGSNYMVDDFVADATSGHNVVASVYVQCRHRYRDTGPEAFRPVGEVEFVDSVAERSAQSEIGLRGVCASIVGHADLRLGEAVRGVLEAEKLASRRFRGVRQLSAWHTDTTFHQPAVPCPPRLLLDATFQAGFACLEPLGLSFDAFLYFTQMDELTALARRFPGTQIILNHLGTPIGVGCYAERREEVFGLWKAKLKRLATCPNVVVKIGGLGMSIAGFSFEERPSPPPSVDLAGAWRPYVETAIEAFGPTRSMFESNFPPDKGSCSYVTLWNAFKRLSSGLDESDIGALFADTARRVYALDLQRELEPTRARTRSA
jgi:predicted TIM-barrel fold metal-dependent hydrolase